MARLTKDQRLMVKNALRGLDDFHTVKENTEHAVDDCAREFDDATAERLRNIFDEDPAKCEKALRGLLANGKLGDWRPS